ncbi:glycosyltransferase family 1 protein [Brevundimonas aurantiaca]|uniref:glycosyltransferase family 4 protein n=1 Tax=Brevundimonas aurantiaca TaxID=74316 RepID=UPI002FDDC5B4
MAIWPKIRRRIELNPAPQTLERFRVWLDRRRVARPAPPIDGAPMRRMFIDVTMISKNDAGTGIQRIVRALALQKDEIQAQGWDVWYVVASRRTPYHRIDWPDTKSSEHPVAIHARAGDVFLGLDYSLDVVRIHERQLRGLVGEGARLWFLVHDLLPIQRPEWFPPENVARYGKWLRVLGSLSEGFLCNSEQTETELIEVLRRRFGLSRGYHTHVLPMGTDIQASLHTTGVPEGFDDYIARLKLNPTILMVGTLEPRKGHQCVLDAFDRLWREGFVGNLVIVGRPGWKVASLLDRLRSHPEHGKHLHWLDNASDEALMRLYEASDGVLLASLAEGFGLPLTEALRFRKPVLARDLAVFRRHSSSGIRYFPVQADTTAMAAAISAWVEEIQSGAIVVRPGCDTDWRDSVCSLLSALDTTAAAPCGGGRGPAATSPPS